MLNIAYIISQYGRSFIANETHGEIVRELQHRGVAVHVLSLTTRHEGGGVPGITHGEYGEIITRLVPDNNILARAINIVSRPITHYTHFLPIVWHIHRWLSNNHVNVLHVEGVYPLGAAVWLATRLYRVPYIVTTTGGDVFDLPHYDYGFGRFRLPRCLIRQTLRNAAWTRSNSPMMSDLVRYIGANPKRLTSIPVSISDSCYPSADKQIVTVRNDSREQLRTSYGWNEPILITSIGRLFNLKAPEQLLYAVPALIKRLGPVRIIIAGPSRVSEHGDYQTMLETLAETLNIAKSVSFLGRITLDEVRTVLAASDVLVVPSVIEGLNRVTIEAAAVGTPTVITATAGAASLVQAHKSGIVVPPGDPNILTDAIISLMENRSLWHMLQTNGLKFAATQTAAAVAAQLHTLYNQVKE